MLTYTKEERFLAKQARKDFKREQNKQEIKKKKEILTGILNGERILSQDYPMREGFYYLIEVIEKDGVRISPICYEVIMCYTASMVIEYKRYLAKNRIIAVNIRSCDIIKRNLF